MAPAWQQEELATKTAMMHSRTAEQSVEEGLANPLRFFANLLTVYVGRLDKSCEIAKSERVNDARRN